jgi:hypothetical protein
MGMGELGEGWVDSADVRHLEDVIMRAHEVRELQHLVGAHLGPAAPAQRRRRLVQRLRRERGRSESAKRNGSVGEIHRGFGRLSPSAARNAEFLLADLSLRMGHHAAAPPRALWRVSAGSDTG